MAREQQADVTLEEYNPWLTPKRKLIAGGVILAVAFTAIIYVVTVNTGQFFLSVDEVFHKGPLLYGKDIRINGLVVPGSVVYGDDRNVSFQILDAKKKAGRALYVVFQGVSPGQFGVPSVEVVLEGSYEADEVFHATAIITRESRKYVPVIDE